MTWSEIGEWLKVAGATVALFGVPLTYRTYRRSVRTRRAEWLASVHEKFFETNRYARIRHVLDYREQPAMGELAAAVAAGEPHELADALWRYLNFLELLAGLRNSGRFLTRRSCACSIMALN